MKYFKANITFHLLVYTAPAHPALGSQLITALSTPTSLLNHKLTRSEAAMLFNKDCGCL